jgi:hypothetical protein
MEPYLGMISLYHLTGSHLPDNNKTQVTLSAKPRIRNWDVKMRKLEI